MGNSNHTLLSFPSTVLLVDDDKSFLSTIGLKLNKNIPLRLCTDPKRAIEIANTSPSANDLIENIINHWALSDAEQLADYMLNADFCMLYEEVYNPKRFTNISTILVDYSMPEVNGPTLCEELRDNPAKKIMLTGKADYAVAVNLFNAKLIDRFIIKDSHNMIDELNTAIIESQQAYFATASDALRNHVLLRNSSCLQDPTYWNFFEAICHEHKISEYYLIDKSGSFLMLDFAGNPLWLVVKSAEEIEDYHNIALDNDADEEIINALLLKHKIPFFLTEEDQKTPVSSWKQYLHPAKKLTEKENYYYATVKGSTTYKLDNKKILSHDLFLQQNTQLY